MTGNGGLVLDAESSRCAGRSATRSQLRGRTRAGRAVLLSQHRFARSRADRHAAERPRAQRRVAARRAGRRGARTGRLRRRPSPLRHDGRLRPDAAAYARVAYARELQGDLRGALQAMRMALTATSPHDVEAQAWHAVQLAALHHQLGRSRRRRGSSGAGASYLSELPAGTGRCAATMLAGSRRPRRRGGLAGSGPRRGPDRRAGSPSSVTSQAARGQRLRRPNAPTPAPMRPGPPRRRSRASTRCSSPCTAATCRAPWRSPQQATRGSRDILSCRGARLGGVPVTATSRRRAGRSTTRCAPGRGCAVCVITPPRFYARLGDRDVAREHLRVALASPTSRDLGEAAASQRWPVISGLSPRPHAIVGGTRP